MTVFKQLKVKELSFVEQEVYRYIINHLDQIPYMRVREIAEGAHVSSTSVFRFVQKAGFDSFPEFRFYIKNNVGNQNEVPKARPMTMEEQVKFLNMDVFHPDIEYQIEHMAESIKDSDLILFMGMGASGAIAEYIARKLCSLGYFSISLNDMTYPIKSFMAKGRKNIVVFLSVSGETKELIEVITGLERENEPKKYCITLNKQSTLAQLCDYSIEYQIQEDRKDIFFDLTSQLPAVAILETLLGYLKEYKLRK